MLKTKIIIALITVVAIGVLATGVVLGHYTPRQVTTYANDPYAPNSGYWDLIGRCYDRYDRPYYPYRSAPTPVPGSNTTGTPQTPLPPQQPTQPPTSGYYYPPQPPTQGYYPGSYRRGCMGW